MTLSLPEIIFFLLAGSAGVYVYQALRVRELALQAAKRACEQEDCQLLDESVSLCKLSMSRDGRGNWRFWRQYRFEYSEQGVDRRLGYVIMLGNQLQALVIGEPTIH